MRYRLVFLFFALLTLSLPLSRLHPTEGGETAPAGSSRPRARLERVTSRSVYSHFLNALLLERYGQLDQALREYNITLQLEPRATLIYRQRAKLHLKMGNPEKALLDTQSYVQSHPNDVESLLLLSNIYLLKGQRVAARLVLEKILENNPDDMGTLMTLAMLLMKDDAPESIRIFKNLVEADPMSIEGYYNLGLLYQKLGELKKSREMFLKVIEIDSDSLASHFILGQMSEREGDIPSAIKYYHSALEMMSQNFALRMQLVLLYAKDMDVLRIEDLLEQFKDDENAPLEANLWLGIVYETKKDWREALRFYLRAQLQNDSDELYIRLAGIYSHLGESKKTLESLGMLIRKFPRNSQYRYFLGLAYLDLKKPRKAIREFKQAIALKEDFSSAHFQIGVALDSMKKWEEAEKMFRKTVEIDSMSASAYNYLGYTYADRNERLFEARQLIEKALEIDQGNPAFIDSLGWLNYREGHYDRALRHLKDAAERIVDPIVYDHLGDCFMALGNLPEAAIYYSKSLDLVPKDRSVRKKMKELNRLMVPTSPARKVLKRFQVNLGQATDISGIIVLKTNFRFLTGSSSRGFFYMRRNKDLVETSTPSIFTEMRVDLMDRFLLPFVVLRYRSAPLMRWSVFPPEFKSQLPAETGDILQLIASFLDGRLLQEFDNLNTVIKETRGTFILRNEDREARFDKKRGLAVEVSLKDRSVKLDRYREVGGAWLPERLRFKYAVDDGSGKKWRHFEILFAHLTLDRIENKIFEVKVLPSGTEK